MGIAQRDEWNLEGSQIRKDSSRAQKKTKSRKVAESQQSGWPIMGIRHQTHLMDFRARR